MNKNVYILGAISFFTDTASSIITTTFPLFIIHILKNGYDKLGVVIATATFVSYFFRVLFGYLSDRYDIRKPFLTWGYLISALSKPLFYFVNSWQGAAVLRSVDRIGKSLRSAPKDSLLSRYGAKKGSIFGIHKMMDVAGEVTGAAVAFFAFYFYGVKEEVFRFLFLFTLFPGAVAVLLTFFIEDVKSATKNTLDFKKDRKLLTVVAAMVFPLVFVVPEGFFVAAVNDMHYVPLYVIVMNLVQTFLSYPLAVLAEKVGSVKVFKFSLFAHMAAFVFLYRGETAAAFVFEGVFLVGFFNSVRIFIAKNAVNKGAVFGVFYLLFALFGAAGGLIVGYLWQNYGMGAVGVYLFACAAISVTGAANAGNYYKTSG